MEWFGIVAKSLFEWRYIWIRGSKVWQGAKMQRGSYANLKDLDLTTTPLQNVDKNEKRSDRSLKEDRPQRWLSFSLTFWPKNLIVLVARTCHPFVNRFNWNTILPSHLLLVPCIFWDPCVTKYTKSCPCFCTWVFRQFSLGKAMSREGIGKCYENCSKE